MKLIKTTILYAATALAAAPVMAQFSGNIDPTFGTSGTLWYTGAGSTSEITKLVFDENSESIYFSGSVYSGGFNATIVKSSLDGDLDGDLPSGTISFDPFIGLDDQFQSVAIQTNGKMVAAGYSIIGPGHSAVVVARFNTDGEFDPTFNGGSAIILEGDGLDFATDVAIQADGKIVIIGVHQVDVSDFNLFFVRLNSDGSFDATFGLGGIQVVDSYAGIELFSSFTILESGKMLAVGQAGTDVLMVQLDIDGNFDSSFSGDGILNFKVNSLPSEGKKVIELADGNLLLAGNNSSDEDGTNGFVIKMDATGSFSFDFDGIDGILGLKFEEGIGLDTTFILQDMEILENGQILVVGDYQTDVQNIALVLINPDGALDTDFGTEGLREYNLSEGDLPNIHSQIELNSNGQVFLAAKVINGELADIVTVRLTGDIAGIDDETSSFIELSAFPNPTTSALSLDLTLDVAQEISISIVDISGQLLSMTSNQYVQAGTTIVNLTDDFSILPSGMYWINVITTQGSATIPVVKH